MNLWHDDHVWQCETANKKGDYDAGSETFKAHLRCMALCNMAEFEGTKENLALPISMRICTTDASEAVRLVRLLAVLDQY